MPKSLRDRAKAQIGRLAAQSQAWAGPLEKFNAGPRDLPATFKSELLSLVALPEAAAAKLARFEDKRSILGKTGMALAEEQQALFQDRQKAVQRHRDLTDPATAAMTGSTLVPADHPSALQAKAAIDAIEARLKDNARQAADVQAQKGPLDQLVRSLTSFLSSGASFVAFAGNVASEGIDINAIRRKIAALDAEARKVNGAPKHSSELKSLATKQIETLAERGKPDLKQFLQYGGNIGWAKRKAELPVTGIAVAPDDRYRLVASANDQNTDAFALAAFLYADDLIARIHQQIDAESNDASALTTDERASRLAEIAAEKLRLERQEEALCEANPSIIRRGDADPRAVLGIA